MVFIYIYDNGGIKIALEELVKKVNGFVRFL